MALEKNLIFYHTHTSTHKKIYTGVASAVANREGAENEHSCRPKARSTYVHTQAHTHTRTHTQKLEGETQSVLMVKKPSIFANSFTLSVSLFLSRMMSAFWNFSSFRLFLIAVAYKSQTYTLKDTQIGSTWMTTPMNLTLMAILQKCMTAPANQAWTTTRSNSWSMKPGKNPDDWCMTEVWQGRTLSRTWHTHLIWLVSMKYINIDYVARSWSNMYQQWLPCTVCKLMHSNLLIGFRNAFTLIKCWIHSLKKVFFVFLFFLRNRKTLI